MTEFIMTALSFSGEVLIGAFAVIVTILVGTVILVLLLWSGESIGRWLAGCIKNLLP